MRLREDIDARTGATLSDSLDARNTHRFVAGIDARTKKASYLYFGSEARAVKMAKRLVGADGAERIDIQARVKNNRWKKIKSICALGLDVVENIQKTTDPRKVWQVQGAM